MALSPNTPEMGSAQPAFVANDNPADTYGPFVTPDGPSLVERIEDAREALVVLGNLRANYPDWDSPALELAVMAVADLWNQLQDQLVAEQAEIWV